LIDWLYKCNSLGFRSALAIVDFYMDANELHTPEGSSAGTRILPCCAVALPASCTPALPAGATTEDSSTVTSPPWRVTKLVGAGCGSCTEWKSRGASSHKSTGTRRNAPHVSTRREFTSEMHFHRTTPNRTSPTKHPAQNSDPGGAGKRGGVSAVCSAHPASEQHTTATVELSLCASETCPHPPFRPKVRFDTPHKNACGTTRFSHRRVAVDNTHAATGAQPVEFILYARIALGSKCPHGSLEDSPVHPMQQVRSSHRVPLASLPGERHPARGASALVRRTAQPGVPAATATRVERTALASNCRVFTIAVSAINS